ncbi:SDR family oxidoreductase [Alicyclobacillaceae bacterium I2511]|nr:SDR family oxidoreductase [Alicyclobacillaceae bacterium I2511]
MDLKLADKTALVTAASRGLGFATAKAFAGEGARVFLCSRSGPALLHAVERIQNETGNALVYGIVADVSLSADIEELFAQIQAVVPGIDILINNAGGPPAGAFDGVDDELWQRAFSLSLMSVVRLTRLSLPHMRQQMWGRIVNFTSSSVKQPIENLILSNTFRTGVAGLSKSLALELAKYNILVNVLGPGKISTDRVAELDKIRAVHTGESEQQVKHQSESAIPLGRYGSPEEFAAMAVFLGSAANGYITGQTVLVDGGLVRSL